MKDNNNIEETIQIIRENLKTLESKELVGLSKDAMNN